MRHFFVSYNFTKNWWLFVKRYLDMWLLSIVSVKLLYFNLNPVTCFGLYGFSTLVLSINNGATLQGVPYERFRLSILCHRNFIQ